jgi:hypothetical protein
LLLALEGCDLGLPYEFLKLDIELLHTFTFYVDLGDIWDFIEV